MYLAWTSSGIILFLRSLHSKFSSWSIYALVFDIPVTVTLDARGYLAWSLLGIILFFSSIIIFKVQFSVWLGLLWVLFYFFDHYIQSSKFSSVQSFKVQSLLDARGYLAWTSSGIIYFFDHYIQSSKFSSVFIEYYFLSSINISKGGPVHKTATRFNIRFNISNCVDCVQCKSLRPVNYRSLPCQFIMMRQTYKTTASHK